MNRFILDVLADIVCFFCVQHNEFQRPFESFRRGKNMEIAFEAFPEPSFHKISRGRLPDISSDRKPCFQRSGRTGCVGIKYTKRASLHRYSSGHNFGEGAESPQCADPACGLSFEEGLFQRSSLIDSLCLPFARRRLRTLRPFFVDILARKPCLLRLFRKWG